MRAIFRITRGLLREVHRDLSRTHSFAAERVGFLACRIGALPDGYLMLAETYHPVADGDYEQATGYGAMMGAAALRNALQLAYRQQTCMVHVHRHDHRGMPTFSRADTAENAKFMPDFFKVSSEQPHGALVLSQDAAAGAWWQPATRTRRPIDEIVVVGRPLWIWRGAK